MQARSLPKGGFANIQWQPGDYEKWKRLLSKMYAKKPLTERQLIELDRLRKTYRIDRYYLFT